MTTYLAGPMTGFKNFNYANFNEAARRLVLAGLNVENPAGNTPPTCGTWMGYMRMAIMQMMTCDSVTVLPGWSESKGANIEVDLALALGIPVVLDHELLRDLLPELDAHPSAEVTG